MSLQKRAARKMAALGSRRPTGADSIRRQMTPLVDDGVEEQRHADTRPGHVFRRLFDGSHETRAQLAQRFRPLARRPFLTFLGSRAAAHCVLKRHSPQDIAHLHPCLAFPFRSLLV